MLTAGLLAALAAPALPLETGIAMAAEVSCETFNECTVGTCLDDGTCQATPANNGGPCETFNPCTTGTCGDGTCAPSPRTNGTECVPTDSCTQENGACSDGVCVADRIPDGFPCRGDLLGPCFIGTCTTVSGFTFCLPSPKCGELTSPCDFNCNLETGACETVPLPVCDTVCTTATCVAQDSFNYTCENERNRPDNSPCEDGSTCTTNDMCQSGECIGGGIPSEPICGDDVVVTPEECDDGEQEFEPGDSCDESCQLVPCGKPTNSTGDLPKASDALFTLKASVQSATCELAVCDVNNSGTVTASDALVILKKAVSQAVSLSCPAA